MATYIHRIGWRSAKFHLKYMINKGTTDIYYLLLDDWGGGGGGGFHQSDLRLCPWIIITDIMPNRDYWLAPTGNQCINTIDQLGVGYLGAVPGGGWGCLSTSWVSGSPAVKLQYLGQQLATLQWFSHSWHHVDPQHDGNTQTAAVCTSPRGLESLELGKINSRPGIALKMGRLVWGPWTSSNGPWKSLNQPWNFLIFSNFLLCLLTVTHVHPAQSCMHRLRYCLETSGQTPCKFLAWLIAKTHKRWIDYFRALPWLNTRL